jgi:hypothetical protein
MSSEWNSLLENETFDTNTQEAPSDHAPVSFKWVFKKKENHDKTIRYKARLVFRGFQRIAGVAYDETYAPVSKLATLRFLLSIAAQQNWQLNHMDVVMAFLNPKIDRDNIFMETPQGTEWLANDTLTSKDTLQLRKALYRLKQAPQLWHKDIDCYLCSLGFLQITMDQNLYSMYDGVLLLLYVDDILIANSPNHEQEVEDIRRALQCKYKMTDLGRARTFLGIHIEQSTAGIKIHQQGYIQQILARFNMTNAIKAPTRLDCHVDLYNKECKDKEVDVKQYLHIVSSLMYASLGTRPDISYAVTTLSRFNSRRLEMHMTAAKRVLRYLKQTLKRKLNFATSNRQTSLYGFTDSDWGGRLGNRKSTSGCILGHGNILENNFGPILWQSKSQTVVSLSTQEVEYIAASEATREAIWLRYLNEEIQKDMSPVQIYCDNLGALTQIHSGILKKKSKHISIKFHHTHDEEKIQKTVKFEHIRSKENVADQLTKALPKATHMYLVDKCGLRYDRE